MQDLSGVLNLLPTFGVGENLQYRHRAVHQEELFSDKKEISVLTLEVYVSKASISFKYKVEISAKRLLVLSKVERVNVGGKSKRSIFHIDVLNYSNLASSMLKESLQQLERFTLTMYVLTYTNIHLKTSLLALGVHDYA